MVFVFAAMFGIIPAALVGVWGGPLWLMILAYTVGGAVSILSVAGFAMLRPMTDTERALMDLGQASDWNRATGQQAERGPDAASGSVPGSRRTPATAQITHLSTARMIAPRTGPGKRRAPCVTDDVYRWPDDVPEDLRLRLLDLLSYESIGPNDIWDEVQDWLVDRKVACPLTMRASRSTTRA